MGWAIRTSKIIGGVLAFLALALSSTQFYRVYVQKLGPGSFMFSIPKIVAGALTPFTAAAGALGAALGLVAVYLERGEYARPAQRQGLIDAIQRLPGTLWIVLAGVTAAATSTASLRRVTAPHRGFAEAFGPDWQEAIPPALRTRMLAHRWSWVLPGSPDPRVERDVAFWTIPGTDRKLRADLWQPPVAVPPSGLAFIYMHGGGYTAFDKGGPTEPWFRHLAAQGHVVMDISYRMIPETDLAGMQGDVKRAITWMKRNAAGYGVNPDRILLGGGSAGSHLALLAGYTPDYPPLTPEDVRDEDLSVRGVVGFYNAGDYRVEVNPTVRRGPVERAVATLLHRLLELWTRSEIAADWSPQLLGGQPDRWPELYRQTSPITHVGPNTPPTLQFVGEHDVYVSRVGGARRLHHRLQEAGVPSVYVEFPRTDHAFDMFLPVLSPAAQSAMYDVDRFLALMALPVDWKARGYSRPEGIASSPREKR